MQTCPDDSNEEPKRSVGQTLSQRLKELKERPRKANPDGLTDYERYIIREYAFQNNPEFCQAKRERVASEYERLKMEGKVPRTSQWYRNWKTLAAYKRKLAAAYEIAASFDVEEFLKATPGTRYQYECLMNSWRHAQAVLDDVDLHSSKERQNQAIDVLKGISFPTVTG